MIRLKIFFKKILYELFGYQPSVNLAKRVKDLGTQSVYNNTAPESEKKLTDIQNNHYSDFFEKVVSNLNDWRCILDYGCG